MGKKKWIKEKVQRWKKFFEWRERELEKKPKESKKIVFDSWNLRFRIKKRNIYSCWCISSILEPSRASSVHNILFHVCEEHAKEFGIRQGPIWADHFIGSPWEFDALCESVARATYESL